MSNPTTPFSWQMPTATDLVTDLPADFEVFGQAVATSMGDLLGGPSGYILSKASATDMDFTWIANDQGDITGVTAGTGITVTSPTGPVPTVSIDTATTVDKTTAQTLTNKTLTSPVLTTPSISNINAKGDILVGTADNTLGIITVGANATMLVANSVETTGMKWTTAIDQFPWTSFTPTLNNWTLGNGTVVGKYQQIGKLVNLYFKFTFGSTSSLGASPNFNLPVNATNNLGMKSIANLEDAGTSNNVGTLFMSTTEVYPQALNTAGTYILAQTIGATLPFTWTTNDSISILLTYEAV